MISEPHAGSKKQIGLEDIFDQTLITSIAPLSPMSQPDDQRSALPVSNGKEWDVGQQQSPSALLDLDFSQDVHSPGNIDSFLSAPLFEMGLSEQSSTHITPFVEDKAPVPSHGSINPQMLVSAPSTADTNEPVHSVKLEPELEGENKANVTKPVPSALEPFPSETVKQELRLKLDSDAPTHASTSFTAFTPMRLDVPDTSSLSASADVKNLKVPAVSISRQQSQSPVPDIDDLRPSLEEYNKMSSKEKRQLRNKISARNFRNRRKEYITLLEDQLCERDSIIKQLQEQLSSLRLENGELQEELRTYRTRAVSTTGVSKLITALQRNAQTSSDGSEGFTGMGRTLSRSSPLSAPNPHNKDVNPSASANSESNAFWGHVKNMHSMAAIVA